MSQLYARLDIPAAPGGVVLELITLPIGMDINSTFSPALVLTTVLVTETTGTPLLGYTWDGAAFHAPVVPEPTPDQLLATKLAAGIQISSQTDDLSGTYAIDDASFANITGLVALIGAGVSLPATPLPYPDLTGVPHSFSENEIKALAGAMAVYVFELHATWNELANGQSATWPTLPITL